MIDKLRPRRNWAARVAGRLRNRLRIGPRKLVALIGLATSSIVIALVSRDLGLILAYAMLAAGIVTLAFVIVESHRRTLAALERPGQTHKTARNRSRIAEPIIAGVASIPERSRHLQHVVASVIDQVDHLYVYLNGYDSVPTYLDSKKITVYCSQDHGDIADIGKFFGVRNHHSGVYFAMDDDLNYPSNYVAKMLDALQEIGYAGVIGVHGVYYSKSPSSFFNRKVIHYSASCRETRPVSLLGTGTIAFPIQLLNLTLDVFKSPRMADVWLAKHLKDRRIPMFAIARPEDWLTGAELDDPSNTIYAATKANHSNTSAVIVSERPWGLDDLVDRVDRASLTGRLFRKWLAFAEFYWNMRRAGVDKALATLRPSPNISDYVAFYAEPPDVLAVAKAALARKGYQSALFRRTVAAASAHDPLETARLLEQATHEASRRGDPVAKQLAARASRNYRVGGDYVGARRLLDCARLEATDSPEIVNESISLAIDRRSYDDALDTFLKRSHLLDRDPHYFLRLSLALAYGHSVEAAAPAITELFLNAGAMEQQNRLISHLRSFHSTGATLRGSTSYSFLEASCTHGGLDPLPTIHLHLALGDRRAAKSLLGATRGRIKEHRPEYLPFLDAAVADSFSETVRHFNTVLKEEGLAPLALRSNTSSPLPLARLKSDAATRGDGDLISVIMTTYNCADTLEYALDSILAQSINHLEIIIVDDCSTDGTRDLITEYSTRDRRVVGVFAERNCGPYTCRNLGLRVANGAYIAIQDSDDYAHSQRLEYQVRLMEENDWLACYVGHVRITDAGAVVPDNHGELVGEGPMTLMMRRRVVQDLGYFLPVRSRGDIEHRDRMITYYGAHRVGFALPVLLLARDSLGSNSRTFDTDPAHVGTVSRMKAEARCRHQRASGRREFLHVSTEEAFPQQVPTRLIKADSSLGLRARGNFATPPEAAISVLTEQGNADVVGGQPVDDVIRRLDLDHRILNLIGASSPVSRSTRVLRRPITSGLGSLFQNQVDVVLSDGSVIQLMEKAVRRNSNEAAFWRRDSQSALVLKDEEYESVSPIDIVDVDEVVVLYFPYLPDLDESKSVVRNNFRVHLDAIVIGAAKLNGNNVLPMEAEHIHHRTAFNTTAVRPSLGDLEHKLKVSRNTARLLQGVWDEVRHDWPVVKDAYDKLPQCLCHNDLGPGNAIYHGGTTMFLDFAMAGLGPVGSDLHTIIRWSGEPLTRTDYHEHLFTLYLKGLDSCGISLTREQLELAAWTTFYMRYTNLRWRSARSADAFCLALEKMKGLIEAV